ncbi:hypothetical protein F5Y19DRAFT_449337 [Xylariaceae sp. FL1651]|nr:hypothetical protein F5Y19DRAFT_449337 [Xylariaceae sp. FL1651]
MLSSEPRVSEHDRSALITIVSKDLLSSEHQLGKRTDDGISFGVTQIQIDEGGRFCPVHPVYWVDEPETSRHTIHIQALDNTGPGESWNACVFSIRKAQIDPEGISGLRDFMIEIFSYTNENDRPGRASHWYMALNDLYDPRVGPSSPLWDVITYPESGTIDYLRFKLNLTDEGGQRKLLEYQIARALELRRGLLFLSEEAIEDSDRDGVPSYEQVKKFFPQDV